MADRPSTSPSTGHTVACGVVVGVLTLGAMFAFLQRTHSAPPMVSPAVVATSAKVPADSKEALAKLNELIGEWRGVGMPRRGSRVGAWMESAEWVWDFKEKTPAVRYDIEKGKLLTSARLTWDAKDQKFHLKATLPDKASRQYQGDFDNAGKLVLESPADKENTSYRITVTPLNEKRTLVLHEQRTGEGFYRRIAEVGYTRAGTSLAVEGAGEIECIVTGGKGTIKVSFEGKTYYVCCSGCKQAFDDDPAGVVAAYKQKVADRKAKLQQ